MLVYQRVFLDFFTTAIGRSSVSAGAESQRLTREWAVSIELDVSENGAIYGIGNSLWRFRGILYICVCVTNTYV